MIVWLVFKSDTHGGFHVIAHAASRELAEVIAKDHGTTWILEYPVFMTVEAYKAAMQPITCGGTA